jgi:hypothetical protein
VGKSNNEDATTKDATTNIVNMVSDKGKGKSFQVELEDGTVVTRNTSDYILPTFNKSEGGNKEFSIELESGDIVKRNTKDYEVNLNTMFGGEKSDYKIDMIPKVETKETKTVYEKIGVPNIIPDMSVNVGVPAVSVTGASKTVDMVNAPSSNWMNRYTGGRSGGDESLGGLKTSTFLLPLRTPRGSAMDRGDFGLTVGGTRLRKSKPSTPVIKRQPKSKKPYGMMTVDDHAILKNIGRDFFKFKVGSPNTVIKSDRARVNPVVNINTDSLGLKKTTKSIITLPKINIPKGKSNTSANINGILNRATKKVKSK